MKNLLFLLALICGTVALIGSCAKKDENATTATTTTALVAASTASGSITVGSETLSGTYATSCITAAVSELVSSNSLPSDTKALGWLFVVTGNDNVTEELHGYSDTTCTTKNFHTNLIYDNVSVGSASGSNYQVLQLNTGVSLLANTTAADTWLETAYSVTITVGTEYIIDNSSIQYYGLWNLSGTTFQKALQSILAYPTELWSIPYTKQ